MPLIPADRLVDWTPGVSVGVPGGIPTDRTNIINVTSAPYNADNTGAVDASAAVQSAINAAPANSVIFLPAGTYKFTLPVSVRSRITIRGAGMTSTLIRYTAVFGPTFFLGSEADYAWSSPLAPITAGLTKGSTSLTLTGASSAYADKLCFVKQNNDTTLPVKNTFGYEGVRRQLVRITQVVGSVATIFPSLYWTMSGSLSPVYSVANFDGRFAGVEDLAIDKSASASPGAGVYVSQGYGCWIKNVKVSRCKNYAFNFTDSLQCEMRGCWADKAQDGGSNHAGLLHNSSSACLIEDNIIDDIFPDFEINAASAGNVFGYNLLLSSQFAGMLNANHNPHNHHNLFEGNVAYTFQSDGYFGSASEDTIFRNWFHGIATGGGADGTNTGITVLKLNRFNRNASVIGNLIGNGLSLRTVVGQLSLGKPNIGNESWSGYAPPWAPSGDMRENPAITTSQTGMAVTASAAFFQPADVGRFMLDKTSGLLYSITGYTSATAVTVSQSAPAPYSGHHFVVSPGPAGWQEIDQQVAATAMFKGNHYYPVTTPDVPSLVDPIANPLNPDVSLGGDIIPASLYRSSKPAFLTGYSWPAIDPNSAPSGGLTTHPLIPAQARYFASIPDSSHTPDSGSDSHSTPPPSSPTTPIHSDSDSGSDSDVTPPVEGKTKCPCVPTVTVTGSAEAPVITLSGFAANTKVVIAMPSASPVC